MLLRIGVAAAPSPGFSAAVLVLSVVWRPGSDPAPAGYFPPDL